MRDRTPDRPTVLVNVAEAKRPAPSPCIEVRFPGPYVELTTAGCAALEDDLRRARLAAADMEPVDATIYPTDETRQLAVAAGVDPDGDYEQVHEALLARIKQLCAAEEPF